MPTTLQDPHPVDTFLRRHNTRQREEAVMNFILGTLFIPLAPIFLALMIGFGCVFCGIHFHFSLSTIFTIFIVILPIYAATNLVLLPLRIAKRHEHCFGDAINASSKMETVLHCLTLPSSLLANAITAMRARVSFNEEERAAVQILWSDLARQRDMALWKRSIEPIALVLPRLERIKAIRSQLTADGLHLQANPLFEDDAERE